MRQSLRAARAECSAGRPCQLAARLEHVGRQRVVRVQPRLLHLLHVLHHTLGVVPARQGVGSGAIEKPEEVSEPMARPRLLGTTPQCVANSPPHRPTAQPRPPGPPRPKTSAKLTAWPPARAQSAHPNRSFPTARPTRDTHSRALARSSCWSLPAPSPGSNPHSTLQLRQASDRRLAPHCRWHGHGPACPRAQQAMGGRSCQRAGVLPYSITHQRRVSGCWS